MKSFTKNKENFYCEKCRCEVIGNGYTNHCPKCLYSKHVDKNPGDREHTCLGLMQPTRVEKKRKDYILTHQCLKCREDKKCKLSKNDDFSQVIEISKNLQN